jgi:co-chaperonin GroES (HSP10)
MSFKKIKIEGPRVALVQLEEEVEGEIVVPQGFKPNSTFQLGKVVSVGPDSPVSEDDIVLFQYPDAFRVSTTYTFDGKTKIAILPAGDVIAKLSGMKVSKETFNIVGKWVLLKIHVNKITSLVLPDNVTPGIENFRFTVEQIGNQVKDPYFQVGDEIVIQRNRASQVFVGDSEYAFCDIDNVWGVVEGSDIKVILHADL